VRPTPLALGILLTALAGPASAVTVGAPVISGSGTAFHDPSLGFDLVGDGVAASTGSAPADGLLVTVPFADLAPAPAGALFVTDAGASFLSGDLARVGSPIDPAGADTLELVFGNLDGSASSSFRPAALLSLTGEFGADPIRAGFGSVAAPVDVRFSIAPVPLPPSLWVLLTGLAGLLALRQARRPA
jgi:hypothetical protein